MRDQSIIERLYTLTESNNVPLQAFIELSQRCNELCKHCYLSVEARRHGGGLRTEEVKSILDQLAEAGCLYVVFTGGEVLLRRDFFELGEYARAKRFGLVVFTNGTLITEEKADRLAALGPSEVDISLYGACAETHDWVTNLPGSFTLSVAAIRRLRARGVKTKMKVPLMRKNLAEFSRMKALAEELDCLIKFDPVIVPMNDGDTFPLDCRLEGEDLERAIRLLVPDRGHLYTAGGDSMCSAGKNTLGINPEGDVYPCLQFLTSWGNLREKSFQEIWFGQEQTPFRSTAPEELEDCHSCSRRQHCSRCPGLALIEDGNWRGKSTAACQVAEVRQKLAHEPFTEWSLAPSPARWEPLTFASPPPSESRRGGSSSPPAVNTVRELFDDSRVAVPVSAILAAQIEEAARPQGHARGACAS